MAAWKRAWVVGTLWCLGLAPAASFGQGLPGYAVGDELPDPAAAFAPASALTPSPAALPETAPSPLAVQAAFAEPAKDEPVLISAEKLKALEPWKIGEYKWVPYGALWADMMFATERTFPGGFNLFVPSPELQGENAFTIDVRRTRVGFNVTGPELPLFGGASSSGQLEVDFFGQFIVENQATIQIRHAYWEAKNECWRMLVGQTWDLMSPLLPNTVSYSVGWMGGNIGFRRPQFRWDRYLDFSPTVLGILSVSLNHDIVPDFSTSTTIDRESTSWPVIESRVGWKLGDRGEGGLPLEFGMSGHIGRTEFDFRGLGPGPVFLPPEDDRTFRTWSLNLDLKAPINECCGFQGELFTGATSAHSWAALGKASARACGRRFEAAAAGPNSGIIGPPSFTATSGAASTTQTIRISSSAAPATALSSAT